MGYIKEPVGVDFVVDSKALSKEDRKLISEAIAYYKATGKKIIPKRTAQKVNRVKTLGKELA
jgi:ribonuclease HII